MEETKNMTRQQKWQRRKKESGCCVICGKPKEAGYKNVRCVECSHIQHDRYMKSRKKGGT